MNQLRQFLLALLATTPAWSIPQQLPAGNATLASRGSNNEQNNGAIPHSIQSSSGSAGQIATMVVGTVVEHLLQAVQEETTYRRIFAKYDLFHEMFMRVDTSASASVGFGLIARTDFYMNAVAQSATDVNLEGEYESYNKVVYQEKNQIWRKVTTSMTIDDQNLNQEIYEYVGVSDVSLTFDELKEMSKDYLNTYLVPNNEETVTPYINDVKHSEYFDVVIKMERIDSNGICIKTTTDTKEDSESKCYVEASLRLEGSETVYQFTMGPFTRGGTRTHCVAQNSVVPSLKIASIFIHHGHNCYDDWRVAKGGFQTSINGNYLTWYLMDYSYDNRSLFVTTGDALKNIGPLDSSGLAVCGENLWCKLKHY